MDHKLEVIGFSVEGCIAAQDAGADRIELCDNPGDGGTTPSYGFIKSARKLLQIELYTMIRPRGGDFIYSDEEFEIMKEDINACKNLGCDGIVLGLLKSNGEIDKDKTALLVTLAYPMGVTFHRAFDRTNDYLKALHDVIDTGCERILTSGLHPTAMEGLEVLQKLIQNSGDLIIMPGSGIRSSNIKLLAESLDTMEFHTSARISRSSIQPGSLFIKENLDPITVDINEIKKIKTILKEQDSLKTKLIKINNE